MIVLVALFVVLAVWVGLLGWLSYSVSSDARADRAIQRIHRLHTWFEQRRQR